MLNVPHTTVFSRVNKLVDKGIIKKFSAVLHPHELGFKINFVFIDTPVGEADGVAAKVAECEDVMKVFKSPGGKIIVKAISENDNPDCLSGILSTLDGYPVTIYPVEEVVKYDHRINDEFIKKIE